VAGESWVERLCDTMDLTIEKYMEAIGWADSLTSILEWRKGATYIFTSD
jgi:hypothetical protein